MSDKRRTHPAFNAQLRLIRSAAALCLALALGAASLGATRPAAAAGAAIVVTTLADTSASADCSLRDAITAANTNAAVGGCAAGSATDGDTITFGTSGTITLGAVLPAIADPAGLTLDGSGQSVTISGGSAVQILTVNPGATLALNGLTLASAHHENGGAIYNSGTLIISASTFSANKSSGGNSGAIFNNGTLTISASTFSANTSDGNSGAIFNNNFRTLTISASTFSGNNSTLGAGAIFNNYYGTLTINASTFSGNSSPVRGGAIWNNSTLTVSTSTFAGSSSGDGSAIINNGGTALVNASTFSGNIASEGSTIASYGSASMLSLRNTIIANSTGGDCTSLVSLISVNNLIQDGSCGASLSGDPQLGPLADNGGSTQTFALLSGSPAIDAGDSASCEAIDQRGVTRPQGNGCDIGAYEFMPPDTVAPAAAPTIGSGTPGSNGWYLSDVTVSWNWSDNPGGSGIDPNHCPASSTSSGEGPISLTATCNDLAGNIGSASYSVKVDKTAPTLSPTVSPNPVLLGGSATASPNAADGTSGLTGASCGALDTSAVGAKSVSCTATDKAGNKATASAGYTVVYGFSGFSAPVDNLPTINSASAGRNIPLKWRLTNANGAPVTNLASVTVTVANLACSAGATPDAIEEYAAGSSGLQNLGDGYYQLNWATPKSYAGSCKTLKLDLGEGAGQQRTALFQFK